MPSPRTAKAPFDASDADIVLRTSDNVEFRLYRVILAMASPVFKDMLSFPQPPSSGPSLPIPVSERSTVLEQLLLFCYPGPPPTIDNMADARLILDAATKYDMACVRTTWVTQVSFRLLMEENPVGVYCLACRYGWEETAKLAARSSLSVCSLGRPSTFTKEMGLTTATAYHNLLAYHAECGRAACAVVRDDYAWLGDEQYRFSIGLRAKRSCTTGLVPVPGSDIRVPKWLPNALHALGDDLFERPDGSTAIDSDKFEAPIAEICRCTLCCKFVSEGGLTDLRNVVATKVQEAVDKVELEFGE